MTPGREYLVLQGLLGDRNSKSGESWSDINLTIREMEGAREHLLKSVPNGTAWRGFRVIVRVILEVELERIKVDNVS